MNALPWFHEMDLGDDVITPGVVKRDVLAKQADVYFRDGLAGMSVIDIGCWDGFNSFEAKRRGAARVLATDHLVWASPATGSRESFELARERLGLDIEAMDIDVPEVSPATTGRFDIVLFCGVLYHLRDPLGGLVHVSEVCDRTLIVETAIDAMEYDRPAMVFYPGAELGDDPSNWWGPNPACVSAMLRDAGFQRIEHHRHPIYKNRAIFRAHRG